MPIDVSIPVTAQLVRETRRAGDDAITALDYELASGAAAPARPVALSASKSSLTLGTVAAGTPLTFQLPDTVESHLNYALFAQWRRAGGSLCPIQTAGTITSDVLYNGSGRVGRSIDPTDFRLATPNLQIGSYQLRIRLTNIVFESGGDKTSLNIGITYYDADGTRLSSETTNSGTIANAESDTGLRTLRVRAITSSLEFRVIGFGQRVTSADIQVDITST